MTGFKSFANRTKLKFEPGLIAIVGPNGCGKSNVSDAVRWVLGEQRPTALRGSKMLDVIFNGTDQRPAMNMAEVSITFANSDKVLDTEFSEVTVTRRVFRTGESHYFLNKTACRLRDIQRLFMGTGIGTTSYSIMAQGQIDAILSSRPEDRRGIFEEAAGITKFKADRKEAIRKLEQTEANLLRLTDVIGEVKRQIGSLQRQANRAARYQNLKNEMRGLDFFVTRHKLAKLDIRLRELDQELAELANLEIKGQNSVALAEGVTAKLHDEILKNEHQITDLSEMAARDTSRLAHAGELIKLNHQRIQEYKQWIERDTHEADHTHEQVKTVSEQIKLLEIQSRELEAELAAARGKREALQLKTREEQLSLNQFRHDLQRIRSEGMECERRITQIHNQINATDNQQRGAQQRRERLAAEHEHLTESEGGRAAQFEKLDNELRDFKSKIDAEEEAIASILTDYNDNSERLQQLQSEVFAAESKRAARQAQVDLLNEQVHKGESFQRGSQMLLDPDNPLKLGKGVIMGTLADKFKTSAKYRKALEAALRAWIDAVVLRHADDALPVLESLLKAGGDAGARLVAAQGLPAPASTVPPLGDLPLLLDSVEVDNEFEEASKVLLANVFIADTLGQVPENLPTEAVVVTLDGIVLAAGRYELWSREGDGVSPLARGMEISDGLEAIATLDSNLAKTRHKLAEHTARHDALGSKLSEMRRGLEESRREWARKEGEWQSVEREIKQITQRVEIVAHELGIADEHAAKAISARKELGDELTAAQDERVSITEKVAEMQEILEYRESEFGEHQQEFTEARITESNLQQQVGHIINQREIYEGRVDEMLRHAEGRSRGVDQYKKQIEELESQILKTESQLEPLKLRAEESQLRLTEMRGLRDKKAQELSDSEQELARQRQALEQLRTLHNSRSVELAESRVRRQGHIDRLSNDYNMTLDQIMAEPDPKWDGKPPPEHDKAVQMMEKVASELQAMGPVNLVAIDEHREHEERYALLKAQEEDLLSSKQQVTDLLHMINKKTSEMFKSTFEQANSNFQEMFTKLFNGGTAQLILQDNAQDPLECGVEIIARPPGKRLQSISLLSGGERTMTAVSLLFAIYMIRPSPFCLLDELDASLDDSNIGRFVEALKGFMSQSQFLIITHNQHTIASSDIVYGVTMPEKGISKVLSMRLPSVGVQELDIDSDNSASADSQQ